MLIDEAGARQRHGPAADQPRPGRDGAPRAARDGDVRRLGGRGRSDGGGVRAARPSPYTRGLYAARLRFGYATRGRCCSPSPAGARAGFLARAAPSRRAAGSAIDDCRRPRRRRSTWARPRGALHPHGGPIMNATPICGAAAPRWCASRSRRAAHHSVRCARAAGDARAAARGVRAPAARLKPEAWTTTTPGRRSPPVRPSLQLMGPHRRRSWARLGAALAAIDAPVP